MKRKKRGTVIDMASHRQFPVLIWSIGGDRKIYPLEFARVVAVRKRKSKE